MSDVSFTCLHCGESLEADESLSGQEIACPSCESKLHVPGGKQKVRVAAKKENHGGCPKCNSATVARCEMVYAQGTTTGKISGTAIGLEVGQGGAVPSFVGGGSVATQSQSLIAQYAAPPASPTTRIYLFGLVGLVIGLPLASMWVSYLMDNNFGGEIYFLATISPPTAGAFIGACIGAYLGPSSAEKRYKKQRTDWQKTWICLSCGHRWIPAEVIKSEQLDDNLRKNTEHERTAPTKEEAGTISEYKSWKQKHGRSSDQSKQ